MLSASQRSERISCTHATEELSQNETIVIAVGTDQHVTVLDLDQLHHN
jgi:hypothetical protein